jgi:hypothetical protein
MTTLISSLYLESRCPTRIGVFCLHHLQGHLIVSACMVVLVHIHHYVCLVFHDPSNMCSLEYWILYVVMLRDVLMLSAIRFPMAV